MSGEYGFGLTEADVAMLLQGCMKPEEIAGDAVVQQARVRELLLWFVRLSKRNANPKWTQEHACELAYYLAAWSGHRYIDTHALGRKSFLNGIWASDEERELCRRFCPRPESGKPAPGADEGGTHG